MLLNLRRGLSAKAQQHMALLWRSRDYQNPSLVPREVVVVIFRKACVQVPVWQVNRAQAGRVNTLEEEVVDEGIVIALIVHIIGVGDLVAGPARLLLLQGSLSAQRRMLGHELTRMKLSTLT